MKITVISNSAGITEIVSRLNEEGHELFVRGHVETPLQFKAWEGVARGALDTPGRQAEPGRVVLLLMSSPREALGELGMLRELLSPGDVLLNGTDGDDEECSGVVSDLESRGIRYLDVAIRTHPRLTILAGGDRAVFDAVEPVLAAIAQDGRYLYCGGRGAGTFVSRFHGYMMSEIFRVLEEGRALFESSRCRLDLSFDEMCIFSDFLLRKEEDVAVRRVEGLVNQVAFSPVSKMQQ